MGKISTEAKNTYAEKVRGYKQEIEQILSREKNILQVVERDQQGREYKLIALAEERANLASLYLLLNRISIALLGMKSEPFLNDARKSCYEAIIHLENVVTGRIDAPFSDYEQAHEAIEGFTDPERYDLVRKIGLTIQGVERGFGDNSKWKWSFVELEGRFAAVSKNIINLKSVVAGLDPRVDGYRERLKLLNLAKRWLMIAADRYREKYELSTTRIDDFKTAIAFLAALRRLHMMLGENDQAEQIRKKADVWKAKMEDDEKRLQNSGSQKPG
ncbi:hypothetical protein [Spirochaeta lutea]|uniref:Uncharacterized protein n=1 Tax=Spirochaeta lutea TaxID=1480694 RepID=A0A098R146_9SPIO|nr:hypothetical protein [Spirochaeta lutea]KGE73501.1 hypothetical protein DC28_02200 [Spirochaeta lutea]